MTFLFRITAVLTPRQTWFFDELDALKSAPDSALSPTTPLRLEPVSAVTPYTPYLPAIAPVQADEPLSLPLSSAMAMRFQALHMTYAQLAELIMYTLRIDIRCRAMHFVDLALRHVSVLRHCWNYED